MSRFIPAQIKNWTKGELIQTTSAQAQPDRFYRGISTDTRSIRRGDVFVALIGPNFDGHSFCQQAIDKGASLLVLNAESKAGIDLKKRLEAGEDLPDLLLVADTLKAYQCIAEGYRLTLLATVIGITGSVGKTTTRRMISSILCTQMKIHQTKDNLNNQIGLPLTLLQADDGDDAIVAEMGMDRRGEIAVLSNVAHPDIAIITGIGYSHAEYLGSRADILAEKTDIISGLKSNGIVLINGQDSHLKKWALENSDSKIWRICNSEEDALDPEMSMFPVFWAEDVEIGYTNTKYTAKTNLDPAVAWHVEIPSPGKHLVRASLFGLAAAYCLGMDMDLAVKGCENFSNTGNRQRLVETGGILLIDDTYNSSPESSTSALDTLSLIADPNNRRKIVCISGMRELGSYSEEMHRRIAHKIYSIGVSKLYLVGEETKVIQDELTKMGALVDVYYCQNSTDVRNLLLEEVREQDCILVKGSRFYTMEVISQALEMQGRENSHV